ncbi:hypothetical protein NBRC13296_12340 [Paenibacillus chitinolyticus]|uniref:hypothetical protein n=1 Tax=Paenibacillus chitinolyticus TaxID=79263 RepID=UPI003557B59A
MRKDFVSTLNKGFQMTFSNGINISVQYGYGNYCENSSYMGNDWNYDKPQIFESNDAEIMIEVDSKPITAAFCDYNGIRNDGSVAGWLTTDEVATAIAWAQGLNEKRIEAAIKYCQREKAQW